MCVCSGQRAADRLAVQLSEAAAEDEEAVAEGEENSEEVVQDELHELARCILVDAGLYLSRETETEWIVVLSHTLWLHVSFVLQAAAEILPEFPIESWSIQKTHPIESLSIQKTQLQCVISTPRELNTDKARLRKKLVPNEYEPMFLVVVIPFHREEDNLLDDVGF
eukprot:CAMPEP_0177688524 /NCGR_PEP_ID=MMETSP0447-20121125/34701_1 /TAXON_ID=0 /ORGANISM="Stygamoeba regulata, Strain BSH-02190019" /LENGTH=165 /DNA_ID=CAMNT_0019198825 /DNA_START=248 /DNA_END=746 /DNA_ORIENTATION=+